MGKDNPFLKGANYVSPLRYLTKKLCQLMVPNIDVCDWLVWPFWILKQCCSFCNAITSFTFLIGMVFGSWKKRFKVVCFCWHDRDWTWDLLHGIPMCYSTLSCLNIAQGLLLMILLHKLNGWQLAKMKKYIPYISLP